MDSSALPNDVNALLRERIHSFEQLQVMLLLWQHQGETWTPESVGSQLNITPTLTGEALDHLCRGNLLEVRVGNESLLFRYSPGTSELDGAVTRLAHAYGEQRGEILRVLSANAVERVRMAAKVFADASLIGGSASLFGGSRKKDG